MALPGAKRTGLIVSDAEEDSSLAADGRLCADGKERSADAVFGRVAWEHWGDATAKSKIKIKIGTQNLHPRRPNRVLAAATFAISEISTP